MPAILIALIPGLIKLAEVAFPKAADAVIGTGDAKKAFVVEYLGKLYDALHLEKVVHDFPGIDERSLFVATADLWIEALLPQIFPKA